MEEQKITKEQVWLGILLVCLVVAGYHISDFITSRNKFTAQQNQTQEIKDVVEEIQKAVSPYQAKDKLKKKTLLEVLENSSKNGTPTDDRYIKTKVTGTLKSGYLYMKASVANMALKENGDVFLMLISGSKVDLGGHLITSKSLETPINEGFTEILFPLDDVKYKPDFKLPDNSLLSGDFLSFLNKYKSSVVFTFSSTELKGKIEDLSIYYECVDNTECSIDVQ